MLESKGFRFAAVTTGCSNVSGSAGFNLTVEIDLTKKHSFQS
jgi:hypothetical protein